MDSCTIKGKPLVLPWGRTPRLDSGMRVSPILGFPSISLVSVSGPKWAPCLARVRDNRDLRTWKPFRGGTTPSKPLKLDKFVQADETVKELDQEEAMDDEEPGVDEVVNNEEHPQDDARLSQDRSKWFKQPPRPETPDPEWSKNPNAYARPEHNWFLELEKTAKDLAEFDDLLGFTMDFSNFIKHCLKKDQITNADLEGPVFKILKGTWRNSIELEYHLEQCYLAFSDQLNWTNPKGDRCPHDLSKPLPLQGPPGRLTILVEFFFNNDLEYLKNGNKERKYAASVTKTKAVKNKSRMSNTSNKGTMFGDGAARVDMQLRSSPKVSTSSPLVSSSSIINVIDVAATFGVPLTTMGDLQNLINDIDAGKHDELLSELTNEDRMETLEALGSIC
ncbi:hypothetical protein Tco_1131154, partial [Tanacetum coccineum]